MMRDRRARVRGTTIANTFVEPPTGWADACKLLLNGRCPYCGGVMLNVSIDEMSVTIEHAVRIGEPVRRTLTWACAGACNP